jgi:hypothetical protein
MTNWKEVAGTDLIKRVEAALRADPAFFDDAKLDFNAALKTYMNIDFPIPLQLTERAGAVVVGPRVRADALSDAELDLVSAGGISKSNLGPSLEK